MDVLQRVFEYQEGALVRTVIRDDGPWFVAADVCRILEIGNPSMAVDRLDDDERTLITIEGASNGLPVNAANEYGVYSLVFTSRKPEAKAFRRWITHEVLPAIRKTGTYSTAPTYDNDVLRMMDQFSRGVDVAVLGKGAQANYFKMQAALARKIPNPAPQSTRVPRHEPYQPSINTDAADDLRKLLSHAVSRTAFDPHSEMELKSSVLYDEKFYYIFPFAAQYYLGVDSTDFSRRNKIYAHIRHLGGYRSLKKFIGFRSAPAKHYRMHRLPIGAVESAPPSMSQLSLNVPDITQEPNT